MVPAWVCAAWGAAAGGSSGRSLQAGRVRRRRAGGQLQRRAPLALPAAPGGRGGGPVLKCHCCSWCCPKRAGEHAARVVRARVDGIRCRTALQAMLQVWVPETHSPSGLGLGQAAKPETAKEPRSAAARGQWSHDWSLARLILRQRSECCGRPWPLALQRREMWRSTPSTAIYCRTMGPIGGSLPFALHNCRLGQIIEQC